MIKPFFEKKLIGKNYDTITFQNGYSKNSPRLKAKYLGFDIVDITHEFFDNKKTKVFKINIGEIIFFENLSAQSMFDFQDVPRVTL